MKTLFQFFLFFLILSNIWFIIKLKSTRSSLFTSELNRINSDATLSADIDLQISQFKFAGEVFKGNKMMLDSLQSIIGKGPKFFLSFNEFSCESCISRAFNDLDSVGKIIGNKNIIILTRYQNERESVFLSKRFWDRYKVFNLNKENIIYLKDENYLTQLPNFFIMDEKMISSFFYYYSINYSNLNQGYFDAVVNYFKNYKSFRLNECN